MLNSGVFGAINMMKIDLVNINCYVLVKYKLPKMTSKVGFEPRYSSTRVGFVTITPWQLVSLCELDIYLTIAS